MRALYTVFLYVLLIPFCSVHAQESATPDEWNGTFSALYVQGDLSCTSTLGEGGRFFDCAVFTGDTVYPDKIVFFLADEWVDQSILYMFSGSVLGVQGVSQGILNGDVLNTYSLWGGVLHKEPLTFSGSWEDFSFQSDNGTFVINMSGSYIDTKLIGTMGVSNSPIPVSLEFSLKKGEMVQNTENEDREELREPAVQDDVEDDKIDTADSMQSVGIKAHSFLSIIFYTIVVCIVIAFGIIFYLTHYTDHFTKKQSLPKDKHDYEKFK